MKLSSTLSGLALVTASSLLAEPISFPAGGEYTEDFENPLGPEWVVDFWLQDSIPLSGVPEMTGSGGASGQIQASNPSALDDLNFGGATFPLTPLKAADSYTNHGFTGSWLVSQAVGDATETSPGVWEQTASGTAKLEFKDLPAHQSIDIFFKLAAFDSFDNGQNGNLDGPFEVAVDGATLFSHQFQGGNSNLNGPGITPLVELANLNGLYREQWNDNAGAGPTDDGDRFSHNWTADSGYDFGAAQEFIAIPHTADTLTIDFIHGLSGTPNDEGVALEDVRVVLNDGLVSSVFRWPDGETMVSDDFDGIPLPNWVFEKRDNSGGAGTISDGGWSIEPIAPSGVSELTATGGGEAQIRPSSGGFDEAAFGGATFPLAPVVAPSDFATLTANAISGNWLQQIGTGSATESASGSGVFDVTNDGIARLVFTNLPPHQGVDIDLLIAAGGSWDGGTANANHDDAFEILVDGNSIFSHFFGNGGATFDGTEGVTTFFTNANVNGHYREQWNDNAGAGPADDGDRSNISWTMDSAYDLGGLPALSDIPHTSDTLTIEFIHRLNSNTTDEQISLDQIAVNLIGVSTVRTEIILVGYNAPLNIVNIEWASESGFSYQIERSFDLQNWDDVGEPVIGEADSTEGIDSTLPPNTQKAYYRVRRL